jgi:ATP-binding cassette subfamily F protein 3
MDDYRRFVLDQARAEGGGDRSDRADKVTLAGQRRDAARARKEAAPLRKKIDELEGRIAKVTDLLARVDAALAAPDAFKRDAGKAAQLAQQRAELAKALEAAEEEWLMVSADYEAVVGG